MIASLPDLSWLVTVASAVVVAVALRVLWVTVMRETADDRLARRLEFGSVRWARDTTEDES